MALRIVDRPPSQPTRYRARTLRSAPVSSCITSTSTPRSCSVKPLTRSRCASVISGRHLACASRMGSRKRWLMRWGGSGVGHQPSGPLVSVLRVRRPGMWMRVTSRPTVVVR